MMVWSWSADMSVVAERMFCTLVGEIGKPQELTVARAMQAVWSVSALAQRESFSSREGCPGKQLVGCSGDEMHIGMGRGAEDEIMVREALLNRSVVDIADDNQV